MKKLLVLSTLAASLLSAEILVYGSSAAAPAMRELAMEFEKKSGEKVIVTSGPARTWIHRAVQNADLVYAPNVRTMDRYIELMPNLSIKDISVINLRQTGLIVRPNNPLKITNFNDILDKKVKVMVMNGGHNSYEAMALKMGNKDNLTKLRKNIVVYARGPEEALDLWKQNKSIDVLIAASHWAKTLGNEALFVEAGEEFATYKATELAPTKKALKNKKVQEFIKFTQSEEGQNILQNAMWNLGGSYRQSGMGMNRGGMYHRNHPRYGETY